MYETDHGLRCRGDGNLALLGIAKKNRRADLNAEQDHSRVRV